MTMPAADEGLRPVPFRIRFYLDSYGVQEAARRLAKRSQAWLEGAIGAGGSGAQLASAVDFRLTPGKLADWVEGDLRELERILVASFEVTLEKEGRRILPRREVEIQENPYVRELSLTIRHERAPRNAFVDIQTDGFVFAPRPIDVDRERQRLEAEIRRASDPDQRDWLHKNKGSISHGKFYRRNGKEVDFLFSQSFVAELADRIGSSSRSGHYKIRWGDHLDFGEKGVDCDLIVNAMDDLWGDHVDAFVFFTTDGDFAPLIERIVKQNKQVVLCGTAGSVSRELIRTIGGEGNFFDFGAPPFLSPFGGSEGMWLRDPTLENLARLEDLLMPFRHAHSRMHTRKGPRH